MAKAYMLCRLYDPPQTMAEVSNSFPMSVDFSLSILEQADGKIVPSDGLL